MGVLDMSPPQPDNTKNVHNILLAKSNGIFPSPAPREKKSGKQGRFSWIYKTLGEVGTGLLPFHFDAVVLKSRLLLPMI